MPASPVVVTGRPWGITPDGSTAQSFTFANKTVRVEVLSFGARLTLLYAPDPPSATKRTWCSGFPRSNPISKTPPFLGCTVGRYANRIAQGRFSLGGKLYQVDRNDGLNSLHGGPDGLWHRNWDARVLPDGVEVAPRRDRDLWKAPGGSWR